MRDAASLMVIQGAGETKPASDAPHILRHALRRLNDAREFIDLVAARDVAADPAVFAAHASELIRQAQILVARAHG